MKLTFPLRFKGVLLFSFSTYVFEKPDAMLICIFLWVILFSSQRAFRIFLLSLCFEITCDSSWTGQGSKFDWQKREGMFSKAATGTVVQGWELTSSTWEIWVSSQTQLLHLPTWVLRCRLWHLSKFLSYIIN